MDERERYIGEVRRIVKRLRRPALLFPPPDRKRLADMLERLLEKWIDATSGPDELAVITWDDPTTWDDSTMTKNGPPHHAS
jgi:hypothetical protein